MSISQSFYDLILLLKQLGRLGFESEQDIDALYAEYVKESQLLQFVIYYKRASDKDFKRLSKESNTDFSKYYDFEWYTRPGNEFETDKRGEGILKQIDSVRSNDSRQEFESIFHPTFTQNHKDYFHKADCLAISNRALVLYELILLETEDFLGMYGDKTSNKYQILTSFFSEKDELRKIDNSLTYTKKEEFEVSNTYEKDGYSKVCIKYNLKFYEFELEPIWFNIHGEKVLRENEDIDRSYFAFPLHQYGENLSYYAVGTFLPLKDDLEDNQEDIYNDNIKTKQVENQLLMFRLFFEQLTYPFFLEQIKAIDKEKFVLAVNSAKAAIMGRNMSHNIGSHVLYYLRNHLGTVRDIVKGYVLDDLDLNVLNGEIYVHEDYRKKIEDLELPFLKGLGTFIVYLQERQDFIAAISSNNMPAFGSANFKDFIIDNLLKDKLAKRHGNKTKKEKNILLDFLIQSEEKKVEFFFNGTSLDKSAPLGLKELNEYEVNLPGSTLGRQAIYSILENIVRNSAKHGDLPLDSKGTLKVNIVLEEPKNDPDHYIMKIIDNCVYTKLKLEQVVANLKNKLKSELIDLKTYKLDEDSKGIKEIKISALWLLGKEITEIKGDKIFDFITVSSTDSEGKGNGNLQYELKVLRAKKMIIVNDVEDRNFKNPVAQFSEYAEVKYEYNKPEEVNNQNISQAFLDRVIKYEIVVDNTKDGLLEKEYSHIFKRIIRNDSSEQVIVDEDSYLVYYEKYLNKVLPRKVDEIPVKLNFTPSNAMDKDSDEKLEGEYFENAMDLEDLNSRIIGVTRPIYIRRHIDSDENLKKHFFVYKNVNEIKGKEKWQSDIEIAKSSYSFVASITGDNSSYRNFVLAKKTKEWDLKLKEAALTKVVVIDERLWKTYKYSKISRGEVNWDIFLAETNEKAKNKKTIVEFCEKYDIDSSEINEVRAETIYEGKEFFDMFLRVPGIETEHFSKAVMTKLQNTDILNLDETSNALVDVFGEVKCEFRLGKNENSYIPKIDIEFIDEEVNVLSIHQGIIDKIYNLWYKSVNEEYVNKLQEELIKDKYEDSIKHRFVNLFIDSITSNIKEKNGHKLIVHSGRSRPPYIDKHVPFASFSSIDFGLRETKIELLNMILSTMPKP